MSINSKIEQASAKSVVCKTKDYAVSVARYAKGKYVISVTKDGSGYKNSVAILAEAVGGKWVHRSGGYTVSEAQAKKFIALEAKKVRAGRLYFKKDKAEFSLDSNTLTPAEVKKIVKDYWS